MGKRADIEAQMAELQKQLDSADPDEDLEVHVDDGTGKVTRLRGRHARAWLTKLGLEEPAADGDGEDQGDADDDDGDQGDAKPPAGHRYFRGKQRA